MEWKRRYWDLFLCAYVFIYAVVTPYRVGFFDAKYRGSFGVSFAFERLTEVIYLTDVVLFYWDVFLLIAKRFLPWLNPVVDSKSHKIKTVNIHENVPW